MWELLRAHRMDDLKFRRQHPIGPFFADFACVAKKIVIEIDGSQHALSGRDTAREAVLIAEGFRIARYWNNDVLLKATSVLEDILAKLAEP